MSIEIKQQLQYNNINDLSKQGKKQVDNILAKYKSIIQKHKKLKQQIINKKNKIQTDNQASNNLSKKYKDSRVKSNKQLAWWFAERYDDCGYIRTKQNNVDRDSTLYQYRLQQLAHFYRKRYAFTAKQISDFKTWYQNKMYLEMPNNYIIDCEDISFNALSAMTYPAATSNIGYSEKFKSQYDISIYSTSKFSYVIDYPTVTKFSKYDVIINVPENISIVVVDRTYNNVESNKLYNLFKGIITVRNNIMRQHYKHNKKYELYKNYVNQNISNKSNTINTYNNGLKLHIASVYLKDEQMNASLQQQQNRQIFDVWIWPSKIINTRNEYRRKYYPPPLGGSYSDNFYQLYTFQ